MKEKVFWQLILTANRAAQGDSQVFEQALVNALAAMPERKIRGFEELLRSKLLAAYHMHIYLAYRAIKGTEAKPPKSEDFLYYRAWLIANGRLVFEDSLQNPDHLGTLIADGTPLDTDGSAMLRMAIKAWQQAGYTSSLTDALLKRSPALDYSQPPAALAGPSIPEELLEQAVQERCPGLHALFG